MCIYINGKSVQPECLELKETDVTRYPSGSLGAIEISIKIKCCYESFTVQCFSLKMCHRSRRTSCIVVLLGRDKIIK